MLPIESGVPCCDFLLFSRCLFPGVVGRSCLLVSGTTSNKSNARGLSPVPRRPPLSPDFEDVPDYLQSSGLISWGTWTRSLPPRVASSRLTEQCPSGSLVGIRCGLLLSVAVSTGVERAKVKRATRPQVLYQPHHFHKRLYGHWYLFFLLHPLLVLLTSSMWILR